MFSKPLHLYVSNTTWLAMGRTGAAGHLGGEYGDPSQADWAAVASALREKFGHREEIKLILSARQCRFAVLPWVSSCFTGRAIRSYVASALETDYGITTGTHHIEIEWPRYARPIFATAYPRTLVEALAAALASAGLDLASATASVGPIVSRHCGTPDMQQGLIAYAEDDGLTAVSIEQGEITAVEVLHGDACALDELEVWASRKRFGFSRDEQMRWLGTASKPEAFPGVLLPLNGSALPTTAGHGVVSACL